jgi:hypothetical protein
VEGTEAGPVGSLLFQGKAPVVAGRVPVEQIEGIYDAAGRKLRSERGKTHLTVTISI